MASPQNEWMAATCASEGLPASYAEAVVDHLRGLSGRIVKLRNELSRPAIIGLNGAQGSGKSTLALFLVEWLRRECGLAAVCLSLDDLYYSKDKREEFARSVHPLFATRGVPGTHDVALGMRALDELLGIRKGGQLALPTFDKAKDDLLEEARWPLIETPVDIVVFEGWCVGATPQADDALQTPVNALERDEDPDGRWRAAVNEHLKADYAMLFNRLDMLVMLRVPSFDKAIEWRRLQESKLRYPLSEAQLLRFIMHFERITRHMLDTGPARADLVIDVDDQHNPVSVLYS